VLYECFDIEWLGETNDVRPVNNPAVQGITVDERLLHPHLGHCSLAAPAVRWLPSAACDATPSFDVRSSGLFCGRPDGMELVTRPSSRSDAFCGQLLSWSENFSSFTSVHSALGALQLCAI